MRRTVVKILVGVLAASVVLSVVVYAFRNSIATRLAGFTLERRSEPHCTHPQISIARTLDRVSIGDIECTKTDGPLRYFRSQGEIVLELESFKLQRVTVEKATVDLRDRDVSRAETNTLGDLASLTGFADMLLKGMVDASELYASDSPPVQIAQLTMKRAGKKEADLYDFRKQPDGEWDVSHAARVETPGIGGVANIRDLDLRVTPSRGTMNIGVFFSKPQRGEEPDMAVHVEGKKLDQNKPQFSMKL
jgi:hypothetical protein